jgi:hypothetical protein
LCLSIFFPHFFAALVTWISHVEHHHHLPSLVDMGLFQWCSQTFILGGGEANAEGARPSRGVRGHAPPGKFWNLESLKCDFKHFGGEILQNSKDYKVHRRHKFSQTFLIFYSELNKLEKSPWKTGGAGQHHLISPLWYWGKKIPMWFWSEMLHLNHSRFYETAFPHSQNCVAFLYDTE